MAQLAMISNIECESVHADVVVDLDLDQFV